MMPRFSPPRYSKNDVLVRLSQDILETMSASCSTASRASVGRALVARQWLGQARQAPTGPSQALQRVAPSRPIWPMAAFFPCANGKLRTRKTSVRSFGKKPCCPSLPHAELRTSRCGVRSTLPADDPHGHSQCLRRPADRVGPAAPRRSRSMRRAALAPAVVPLTRADRESRAGGRVAVAVRGPAIDRAPAQHEPEAPVRIPRDARAGDQPPP